MKLQIRLLKFIKGVKKELLIKIFLGLILMALSVLKAFSMARGTSYVLGSGEMDKILFSITIALICIILRGIVIRIDSVYTKKSGCKIKAQIRKILTRKLSLLGPQYQNNRRSGKILSLITDGVESLENYLMHYVPQAIISICTVAFLVIYITKIDILIGSIIFFCVLIAVLGPHISRIRVQEGNNEYWKSYAILNSQYIDTIAGMSTLKAFNACREKGKELEHNCWQFYARQLKITANSLVDSAFVIFCTGIGTSFSVGLAAYHASIEQVNITALLSILFLIPECFKPISDLNNYWHQSYTGFSIADQLFEILDEPLKIIEKEDAFTQGLDENLPNIAINNVSFSYNGKDDVLEDISINIHPGQTVALVGHSGSGKSTVVNILLRFYDADKGEILYNGKNIRDYSLEYLRSKISVVFQDTYLFYATIRENIAMAKPDADMDEIIHAAKSANIHDFIQSLPDGYDTIVGERGANLSGGERQRIAIARAILKNAPFLILDEATASVDAENERDIQLALENLMQNKTSLVIAHRLSTIQNADKIYVLEEHRIVEEGTNRQLLAKNGIYKKLVSAQNRKEAVIE